jgi:acetyl esterase
MINSRFPVLLFLLSILNSAAGQFEDNLLASYNAVNPQPTEIFKIRDRVEVHYFAPSQPRIEGINPAYFFIHGGGWRGGRPDGSYRWCRYLAEHGVSAFTIRYQLANENSGIEPIECLKDAKTALRWVRANAKRLGIDPDQIAVAGHSAGGHLAAALATIDGYNHPDDDLSVSCRPNLLLLVSPVMDNSPGGFGNGHNAEEGETADFRVSEYWESFSPVNNLNDRLPSAIVVMGTNDPLIQMEPVKLFGQAVEKSGSDFEWWVFPGKGHGLTRAGSFSQTQSYLTPQLTHIYYAFHRFLAKHNYIDPPALAGDEVRTLTRPEPLY